MFAIQFADGSRFQGFLTLFGQKMPTNWFVKYESQSDAENVALRFGAFVKVVKL